MTADLDLDIVRAPAPRAAARPRYSVERTLGLPAFWAGAAATREAVHRDDRSLEAIPGLARCYVIEAALRRGEKLSDIAAYADWLSAGGGR